MTCKTHFVHISDTLADIQLSIFQLTVVKLLEVFAQYANTGKEMLSPFFIDSSIDNVLLQTNPGSTRRFFNSQTFLNFIW